MILRGQTLGTIVALLALLGTGCANTKTPSQWTPPQSERDRIIDLAFDHLVDAGEIDPDRHRTVAHVSEYRERPGSNHPWSYRWKVSFDLLNVFNEPIRKVSTIVRQYDEAEGPRYEVESDS